MSGLPWTRWFRSVVAAGHGEHTSFCESYNLHSYILCVYSTCIYRICRIYIRILTIINHTYMSVMVHTKGMHPFDPRLM